MNLKNMKTLSTQISWKVSSYVSKGFTFCFPALRIFVAICNIILLLFGVIVFGSAIVMYIVPSYHLFLDALKHIFNVHTIFGSAIILGALTICIGIAGLHFLSKAQYDKLGLQAATFMVLLIVMASLAFTFWTEWKENAHFGISYATQSFNPYDKHGQYFKSIQEFLLCCGSDGPEDYDIGNEHFKVKTVPLACCNYKMWPQNCSELIAINKANNKFVAISVEFAFKHGCMIRMEKVIWPIIIYIIFIQSSLSLVSMIATATLIIGYQSYLKPKSSQKKNSRVVVSNSDYDESIQLENKE